MLDLCTKAIRLYKSAAHPGSVLIYRVEYRDQSVVYATDTEGYANIERKLAHFARGADQQAWEKGLSYPLVVSGR